MIIVGRLIGWFGLILAAPGVFIMGFGDAVEAEGQKRKLFNDLFR